MCRHRAVVKVLFKFPFSCRGVSPFDYRHKQEVPGMVRWHC